MTVAILDTGIGNFGSIASALRRIGGEPRLVATPEALADCTHIVLPGVGNFDAVIRALDERGLRGALAHRVLDERIPLLGICLGMQLLGVASEEGHLPGFGWLPGRTIRLDPSAEEGLRVPHIGWNGIAMRRPSPLLEGLATDARFYYVHSYHYVGAAEDDAVAVTNYGGALTAVLCRDNIVGTQFHPERSGDAGLRLLQNFLALDNGV